MTLMIGKNKASMVLLQFSLFFYSFQKVTSTVFHFVVGWKKYLFTNFCVKVAVNCMAFGQLLYTLNNLLSKFANLWREYKEVGNSSMIEFSPSTNFTDFTTARKNLTKNLSSAFMALSDTLYIYCHFSKNTTSVYTNVEHWELLSSSLLPELVLLPNSAYSSYDILCIHNTSKTLKIITTIRNGYHKGCIYDG